MTVQTRTRRQQQAQKKDLQQIPHREPGVQAGGAAGIAIPSRRKRCHVFSQRRERSAHAAGGLGANAARRRRRLARRRLCVAACGSGQKGSVDRPSPPQSFTQSQPQSPRLRAAQALSICHVLHCRRP